MADLTVDKTMRVTTTLGFFVSVVIGVWFIGRWTDQIEDENILLYQEIHNVLDIAERNERRLQVYIDRFGLIHVDIDEEMDDIHHEAMDLREYLAARFGEVIP